jgi:hypothetical protein
MIDGIISPLEAEVNFLMASSIRSRLVRPFGFAIVLLPLLMKRERPDTRDRIIKHLMRAGGGNACEQTVLDITS